MFENRHIGFSNNIDYAASRCAYGNAPGLPLFTDACKDFHKISIHNCHIQGSLSNSYWEQMQNLSAVNGNKNVFTSYFAK